MKETLVKYQGTLTAFGTGVVVGYTQHYYIGHSIHGMCMMALAGAGIWGYSHWKAEQNQKQPTRSITGQSVRQSENDNVIEAETIDLRQYNQA